MTKTATDWIAYLEAEPRSEPDLSIAAVLREQAKEIEGLISDNARLMESLTGEVNESERLRGLLTCSRCGAPATKWLRAQLAAVEPSQPRTTCRHPREARGLTGCLLCGTTL